MIYVVQCVSVLIAHLSQFRNVSKTWVVRPKNCINRNRPKDREKINRIFNDAKQSDRWFYLAPNWFSIEIVLTFLTYFYSRIALFYTTNNLLGFCGRKSCCMKVVHYLCVGQFSWPLIVAIFGMFHNVTLPHASKIERERAVSNDTEDRSS